MAGKRRDAIAVGFLSNRDAHHHQRFTGRRKAVLPRLSMACAATILSLPAPISKVGTLNLIRIAQFFQRDLGIQQSRLIHSRRWANRVERLGNAPM